ncbi:MAG: PstS family phosphate ABC transporter substrate-binding protein [Phycisphaerales bacterium]
MNRNNDFPLVSRRGAIAAIVALAASPSILASAPQADAPVDSSLPPYERVKELDGRVRIVGSSAVCGMLARASEQFRTIYPKVQFDVRGGGTATAVAALVDGSADIAPMSRAMTAAEVGQFQAAFKYAPTGVGIGFDAIAIFVNRTNPMTSASIDELAAIFGNGARGKSTAKTWGDVGLGGEWRDRKIVVFGSRPDSGGSGLLREAVLADGEFRADMKVQPGSSGIVNGVGADPAGVGYASQFYGSKATRTLALSSAKGAAAVEPSKEAVANGSYPLSRRLFAYVNRKGGTPLPAPTLEFMRFVLSRDGQSIIAREGGFALAAGAASAERAKLG